MASADHDPEKAPAGSSVHDFSSQQPSQTTSTTHHEKEELPHIDDTTDEEEDDDDDDDDDDDATTAGDPEKHDQKHPSHTQHLDAPPPLTHADSRTPQLSRATSLIDGGVLGEPTPVWEAEARIEAALGSGPGSDLEAGRPVDLSRAASSVRSKALTIVPRAKRRGLFGRFTLLPEVERPYEYTNRMKWAITAIIAFAAMAAPMGSSIFYRGSLPSHTHSLSLPPLSLSPSLSLPPSLSLSPIYIFLPYLLITY